MAAAVRHTWVFRTAAVVFLLFGVFWIADATLTDRFATMRPYLVGGGIAAIVIGFYLFRGRKFAIAVSGLAALVVAIAAIFAVPLAPGLRALALALLAVAMGLYVAIAARTVFGGKPQ